MGSILRRKFDNLLLIYVRTIKANILLFAFIL